MDADLSLSTEFGYICRRCSRCCRHQHIQVDPYEVARLARARGECISNFVSAWTIDGQGTALRQNEDGTCVFLGPDGCEVHADRPLVCRLYPLGRHLRSDGFEYYTKLNGHPQSEGQFTEQGTIADYLAAQGAEPYLAAHDGYFKWLCWAQEQLNLTLDSSVSRSEGASNGVDLLDMDGTIERHCAASGVPQPQSIDDRLRLHLKILYAAVAANMEHQHAEENTELGKDWA
jgi:Fe-S-cluster containining protein